MELKPFMRPAGEEVSEADQKLAYHSLATYIRHTARGHSSLAQADPRSGQTTLYLASANEIGALSQARTRPDSADRWVFVLDAVGYMTYRYKVNPTEQNVRRLLLDMEVSKDIDDALHDGHTPDNVSFLRNMAANLIMDREYGTNLTPVGLQEVRGLTEHLRTFTPVSFETAMNWRPEI